MVLSCIRYIKLYCLVFCCTVLYRVVWNCMLLHCIRCYCIVLYGITRMLNCRVISSFKKHFIVFIGFAWQGKINWWNLGTEFRGSGDRVREMSQHCFVAQQLNTTQFCRETLKYGTFCRETLKCIIFCCTILKYALRGNNSE